LGGDDPEDSTWRAITAGKNKLYLRLPRGANPISDAAIKRLDKKMREGTPDDWFQQFIDWIIGHLFPNHVHGDLSKLAKKGSREFYRAAD
jgi:hypothetical protein